MTEDEYPLHAGVLDSMLTSAAQMMEPPPDKPHLTAAVLEQIVREAFRAGWSMSKILGDLQEAPLELRLDMSSGYPTVMAKR